MSMATTEEQAVAPPLGIDPPEVKEEGVDQGLAAFHEGADDDDLPPGWLVISDGEQIVIPHPEDKTKEEVVEAFFKAKKSNHHAFQLGLYVFDPGEITTFGWSEDIHFPEIEKFDGLQERIEMLMQASTELTHNQAQLQAAQAMLFQGEDELLEDDESAMDVAPSGPAPLSPAPAPVPATAAAAKKKGGFRPPGA